MLATHVIECLKMKRLSEYIHIILSTHETQDKCILRQKSVTQSTGYESKVSKRIAKITLLEFFQRKAFKF